MTRKEAIKIIDRRKTCMECIASDIATCEKCDEAFDMAISALNQEPCEDGVSRRWNNHQVACLLADMFDDACACNYNGIDEWLPDLCDFKDTCCPKPVGVACWEQFLKHSRARYCECGYEMR